MIGWLRKVMRVFNSTTSNPASWFVDWIRGTESDSGIEFGPTTALRYPPIWYAVNKIGGHCGIMPLVLYRQSESSGRSKREKATKHPSYRLMKTTPNEHMTAAIFKETLTSHAILWGNGRAAIMRTRNTPSELIVMDPARTSTVMIGDTTLGTRNKYHVFREEKTNKEVVVPDRDVLHIPGLGYDGVAGYSVIELMKNSLGLGLASEKAANRFYRNNAVPSLVLEAPPGVFRDQTAAEEFLARFNKYHSGADNTGKVGLLREGIKANTLAMSGRDAQFIEQRKFQRQEAALWMLLEQILGDDSSVSYNSLEQKNLGYLTNCLLRWLNKWEQECARKLLTTTEQAEEEYYFKFTTAALLRGTTKERYEVYEIARRIETMSINDIRELEDLNPIEGGDEYINPNINPQELMPDDTEDDDDEPDDVVNATDPRLWMTVNRQLRDLVRLESKEIRDAVEKHANYVAWLDTFYDGFTKRLANIFERCGGTWKQAEEYAAESKLLLLEACGNATNQDELRQLVQAETYGWVDRADKWTERILEK